MNKSFFYELASICLSSCTAWAQTGPPGWNLGNSGLQFDVPFRAGLGLTDQAQASQVCANIGFPAGPAGSCSGNTGVRSGDFQLGIDLWLKGLPQLRVGPIIDKPAMGAFNLRITDKQQVPPPEYINSGSSSFSQLGLGGEAVLTVPGTQGRLSLVGQYIRESVTTVSTGTGGPSTSPISLANSQHDHGNRIAARVEFQVNRFAAIGIGASNETIRFPQLPVAALAGNGSLTTWQFDAGLKLSTKTYFDLLRAMLHS